jgi:NAD(P)-dependent dehydrogenase (short-subunit alcohol dehydrogenase family)
VSDTNTIKLRAALVTGAAQGLGAAIAIGLACDGFDVAIADLTIESLQDTDAAVTAAGRKAVPVALDLRSQESIDLAMRNAISGLGQLDVLINNAGVALRRSALEVTPDEWDAVMAVNLKGTFFISQQMGRHLVATKRPGCIVSLASTHGVVGFPGRSTYGIAKAAVAHMTKMLAIEWAEYGIRVNAVAPGTIETPSREEFFKADPQARVAMTDRVPLRRFGTPAEVAGAVCYLVSPQAAYITGQTLMLDGGLTAF